MQTFLIENSGVARHAPLRKIVTHNAMDITGRLVHQILNLLRVIVPYNPRGNARTKIVDLFIMTTLRNRVHVDPKRVQDIIVIIDLVMFAYCGIFIPACSRLAGNH